MEDNILVFTDGSTKNNGKKNNVGGWGVFIMRNLVTFEFKGKVIDATNQKSELMAINEALKIIKGLNLSELPEIKIYSDSMYSINSISNWAFKQKENNWIGSNGNIIANFELIYNLHHLFLK